MILKSEIRKAYKQRRNAMNEDEVLQKSKAACEIFLQSDIYYGSKVLMLYMPLGNEADTAQIMTKALSDGKKIVLPVTDTDNTDILPFYADSNTEFSKGAFSIREPDKTKMAQISEIDTVVVPGIAFSKAGARVGFGKGFYDRFLERTNAVKTGFCYGWQICDEISFDAHDVMMDFVVSENGMIACNG